MASDKIVTLPVSILPTTSTKVKNKFKRNATKIRFSEPFPEFSAFRLFFFIKRDRPFLHLPYSVFEKDGPCASV